MIHRGDNFFNAVFRKMGIPDTGLRSLKDFRKNYFGKRAAKIRAWPTFGTIFCLKIRSDEATLGRSVTIAVLLSISVEFESNLA